MNNNKTHYFLPFLLGFAMALGLLVGYQIKAKQGYSGFFNSPRVNTLQEIVELINIKYVDPKKTDSIGLSVIPQLLEQLDPHSAYISPEEMTATNDDITGSFCGIGIEYYTYQDTIFVTKVIQDGPAQKAGLAKNDQIVGIDNRSYHFSRLSSDSMSKVLKGDCGSQLKLNVKRNGASKLISIERMEIPDNSVAEAFMTDELTGYIKIEKFTTRTHAEFMAKLNELNQKGMKKLVLDLRDNGGGVLSEATEIADEFLDGDKLITYTAGNHRPKKEIRCRRLGQFEKGDLIVLCNRESASASEILMGALQDWDRATIIGERSFGKGLVQEIFDLSNGGALRLTVSRYYTPLGRCIQRSYTEGIDAYYENLADRSHDNTEADPSHLFTTPKGKKLYANNGIKPDLFITSKADSMTELTEALITQGPVYYFSHQLAGTVYKNIQPEKRQALEIMSQFNINEDGWNQLRLLAVESGIEMKTLTAAEKATLTSWIKSIVTNFVWGSEQTTLLLLSEDPVFIKSKEILKK